MTTEPHITLRLGTAADAPLLRHWDKQPHLQDSSDPEEDWQWEKQLPRREPWMEMLMAMLGERPIGFVQIIDPAEEETHYWGDVAPNLRAIDIWIGEVDCINRGYGTKMMTLAFARCFANPDVTAILIDPRVTNSGAIRFYQRLGFQPLGERKFDDELCLILQLDRATWEERYGAESAG